MPPLTLETSWNGAQEPYLTYILRLSSTDCMQNATVKSTIIIFDPGHVCGCQYWAVGPCVGSWEIELAVVVTAFLLEDSPKN
jgi:hypothetical protein